MMATIRTTPSAELREMLELLKRPHGFSKQAGIANRIKIRAVEMTLEERDEAMIEITSDNPVVPDRETLIECGGGAYGLGNNFTIDWDRFYELLEMYGWDMQDLGGTADNKIRRIVRKAVRDGEVT